VARVHNQISRGDLTQATTRALGVTREAGGIERYSETLTPVMNPWGMPEWAYLRGEALCGFLRVAPLLAAEFGVVGIGVPAGSNLIVVVEAAGFGGSAAMSAELQFMSDAVLSGTAATATAGVTRDRRAGGPSFISRALVRFGTDPAANIGSPVDRATMGANASIAQFGVALPIVLTPGRAVAIVGQTVALDLTGIFAWRERLAYPGELV